MMNKADKMALIEVNERLAMNKLIKVNEWKENTGKKTSHQTEHLTQTGRDADSRGTAEPEGGQE